VCINGDCRTYTQVANTMCKNCSPTPRTNTHVNEIRVAGKLKEWADGHLLAKYTTWNRQNPHAEALQCGRYRPDFLFDILEEQRVVILEVDEDAHRSEAARCEFVRPLKLALGFGGAPVHMIRYNPDLLTRVKTMPERREREALLLQRTQAALAPRQDDNRFGYILTLEFLYYFDILGSVVTAPYVQTIGFATVLEYEAWAEAIIAKFENEKHRAADRLPLDCR
jgi:hypothetical protein